MGVVKKYVIKSLFTTLCQWTLEHSCKYFTWSFSFVNLQKKNKQFFYSIVSLSSAVKQFQQLYI